MPYPVAPWHLAGDALAVTRLIPLSVARRFMPYWARAVPMAPGMTTAALYLASYGGDSSIAYHELIVSSGVVRTGLRMGAWISHIYVDNVDAATGGRDIWGLPKQAATFEWQWARGLVEVHTTDQLLCTLRFNPSDPLLPAPLYAPVLTERDARHLWFAARGVTRLGVHRGTVIVPAGSPLADVWNPEARTLAETSHPLAIMRGLRVTVPAPIGA